MIGTNERTLDALKNLVASSRVPDLFDPFCQVLANALPAETIAISAIDVNSRTYTPVHRWGRKNQRFKLLVPRSLVGTTLERLSPESSGYLVSDDQRENLADRTSKDTKDPFIDLHGWIVSPLIDDGQLVGAIQIRAKDPNAYSEKEVETLDRLGNVLAPAFAGWSRLRVAEQETEILTVLASIGKISNSSLDLVDSYSAVAQQIAKIIPFTEMRVETISAVRTTITVEFDSANPQSAISTVATEPQLALIEELDTERTALVREPDLTRTDNSSGSSLHSPITWNDQLIGMISYSTDTPRAFGLDHQSFADLVSDQLAGAIATSRRYRAELRQSKIDAALAKISLTASTSSDLNQLFEAISQEIRSFLQFDRLAVILYNRDSKSLTLAHVTGLKLPGEQPGDDVSHPEGPPSWDRYFLEYRNARPTKRDKDLGNLGLKSWLQVPIGMQSEGPDGVISLRSVHDDHYSDDDLNLLAQISRQLTPSVQNALLARQREILSEQQQLAAQLDAENVELQRIADERSEFLSTVSHELRTPLTTISAFGDILARNRSGNLAERDLQQIEAIRRSATTLTGLIDDLLDLSRADTGNLNISPTTFQLEPLFAEVNEVNQSQLERRNQRLVVENVRSDVWLRADRNRLAQILNNLVSNASKYSPNGSQISLGSKVGEFEITFSLSDQGIGISEQDMPHILTPFFRSSASEAREVEGTGLGLSIVNQLVTQHSGKMTISSEVGKGTTVSVMLPCVVPAPE